MNFQDLRIIVGQIKKNVKCPKCKGAYKDQYIEVIGALSDNHTFFRAVCMRCSAEAVINVNIEIENGEIVIPELKSLVNNMPRNQVSINEVLDIHNFLDNFDGNFQELFKAKK